MSQENIQLLNYYSDENGLCYLMVDLFERGQKERYVSAYMEPIVLFQSIKDIARYDGFEFKSVDMYGKYKQFYIRRRHVQLGKELESFLIEFAWMQTFYDQFELPECIRKKPFNDSLETPDLLDGL